MKTTTIAAWLLTYLVHSTILLGAVLAVARVLRGRSLALQESLLRVALVGGVLTATLQLGFGVSPLSGALSLPTGPQIQAAEPVPVTQGQGFEAVPASNLKTTPTGTWATLLVAAWSFATALALLCVLRSVLDLRRLLLTRSFRPAGRLVEHLAAAMGLRRLPRLSTSKAIAVPFATGIRKPEICCPERVQELAREHQTGLFAHELAHLARRDPLWQFVYRVCEALFVLQPLNRLVRRRLEEVAEHLTDERAAACTGDRLGLARCLVVVAHWGHSSHIGLPATALANGPRLDRRVRHLISGTTDLHRSNRWALAAGIALLVGSVSILPAVAPSHAHAESPTPPTHSATVWSIPADEEAEGRKVTGETTWSTADDRPTATSPAAEPSPRPASAKKPPNPPTPADAPPAPETAPALQAAPSPSSPPVAPPSKPHPASTPPRAPPAPAASPAPSAAPDQQRAPAPVVPPVRTHPSEVEKRQEDATRRTIKRYRARPRTVEVDRKRNEALARERREAVRVRTERAHEMALETARRARAIEVERERIQRQIRGVQAGASRIAREESAVTRDRARIVDEEARGLARDALLKTEQLTAEQRKEMQQKAIELRARMAQLRREQADAAQARARELANQARRLAEQAEAERLELERSKR